MSRLRDKRVLVVEDEAIVLLMLEDILDELGVVPVGPASTLAQAVELATSAHIDAALLDVNIRGERIDEVAEILRARGIPIVFTTGYGQSILPGASRSAIVDKPYTKERIVQALISCIEGPEPSRRSDAD